ncbi:MAG TPA: hypothetical protein O0X42_01045 [Methanocorpusculum sp.]|nr:hypothetical protein [Methanocorpusculum sp.]
MSGFEEDFAKFKKIGTAGFVCDVIGFVLAIATYVFCYIMPLALEMLPDIPALRITLVVITVIALVLGIVLEAVGSMKSARPKWQIILGIVFWVLGAVFCTMMIRMLFS